MRTLTTKTQVFQWSELSEEAKKRAALDLNQYYFWELESIKSLEAFAAQFGVTIKNWACEPFSRAEIEVDATPANFRGFTLAQARSLPEWPTGYYLDEVLRKTFICEFERTRDAFSAFNDAMHTGITYMRDDWEAQYEDDYMRDHCDSNSYEFTKEGRLI